MAQVMDSKTSALWEAFYKASVDAVYAQALKALKAGGNGEAQAQGLLKKGIGRTIQESFNTADSKAEIIKTTGGKALDMAALASVGGPDKAALSLSCAAGYAAAAAKDAARTAAAYTKASKLNTVDGWWECIATFKTIIGEPKANGNK